MNMAQKINTSFQLPTDLLAQIREIARLEGRSVSSQIRIFLGDAVTRKNTEWRPEIPLSTGETVPASAPEASDSSEERIAA